MELVSEHTFLYQSFASQLLTLQLSGDEEVGTYKASLDFTISPSQMTLNVPIEIVLTSCDEEIFYFEKPLLQASYVIGSGETSIMLPAVQARPENC